MIYLSEKTLVTVRFSEVDPLAIVWHGHYVRYFEDAREAFGKKFGLSYSDVYKNGFVTPIVSINCNYKKPLMYGDIALVEARFIDSAASKIIMEYEITHAQTNELIATGSTTQVFLKTSSFELQLIYPDFFIEWRKKWDLVV